MKRKKCALGALAIGSIISALASAIGTGVSIYSNKKNAERQIANQNEAQNQQNAIQQQQNIQANLSNRDYIADYQNKIIIPTQNTSQMRCGGKRKVLGGINAKRDANKEYFDRIQMYKLGGYLMRQFRFVGYLFSL